MRLVSDFLKVHIMVCIWCLTFCLSAEDGNFNFFSFLLLMFYLILKEGLKGKDACCIFCFALLFSKTSTFKMLFQFLHF